MKTISNILGGVLLAILSIQFISLLNALTFLIAFLGILFIKNDLLKVEKTISYQEGLSVKSFCQHLVQSSKLIWNMNKVLLVLFIISISQAVINVTVPISTLFLRNQPFFEFTNWSISRFVINTGIVSPYCRKPCKWLSEKYDFYKNSSICLAYYPITPFSWFCGSFVLTGFLSLVPWMPFLQVFSLLDYRNSFLNKYLRSQWEQFNPLSAPLRLFYLAYLQ